MFNNALVDGSFGVTAQIFLDQLTPWGTPVSSLTVPTASRAAGDQMVTSFSSKSELALNLSTDGRYVTFMGYVAPVGAIDVSNSNTPGVIDPTNPVAERLLPRRRASWTRTASSSSPRPTPTAATTAAPRS